MNSNYKDVKTRFENVDLWDLEMIGARIGQNPINGSKDIAQFNEDAVAAVEEMERIRMSLLDAFTLFQGHPNSGNWNILVAAMAAHQESFESVKGS